MKRSTHTNDHSKYVSMGMAALIPGMQYVVELMQKQLDDFRAELAALQGGNLPRRGAGRPPKDRQSVVEALPSPVEASARSRKVSSYWAQMTPEQRSTEMQRRFKVRESKKTYPISDPRNPKHEAWKEKLRAASKKHWSGLTPKQKKAKTAALLAGKVARHVNGAAAESVQ